MKRSIDSTTAKVQSLTLCGRQRRTTPATPPGKAGVPTLAVLAAPYGIRVYRDKCGDENLPGRFGEIFRHGPDCLAVQFGGPRANGTRIPSRRKMRWRLRQTTQMVGLRRIVVGEDEVLFHFPDALLPQVAHLIGAYRAYAQTGPSETRAAAA